MKKFFLKHKYIIGFILLILVLFVLIALKLYLVKENNNNAHSEIVSEKKDTETKEELEEDVFSFAEIKGAVNVPGVYVINDNDRISNFIDKAGGLRDDANINLINLSKKVTDEMVIIIYTNDEVYNSNTFNTVYKVVENECVCPSIKNDGCLYNDETGVNSNFSESNSSQSDGKVNINTASVEELMTISGIGETKARAIISYREEHGNFESIDDILNVSGIGQSTFDKIKENITV